MKSEKYFYEAFENMNRLAPGSTESTERAIDLFGLYNSKEAEIKILDIGCGRGAHTFTLAEHFPKAYITAIDINSRHIKAINEKAEQSGMSEIINAKAMSMFEMNFDDKSFDLIWAEGSVYIAGFTNGIKDWKHLLKKGGSIVCSEISWLRSNPSEESLKFWSEGYSEMNTISSKIKQIESAGYLPYGHFICPVTDWTDNYYTPLRKNLQNMKEKYKNVSDASDIISALQTEIDIYSRHSDDYSYVFYLMKNI